jgi:hypothetical protein
MFQGQQGAGLLARTGAPVEGAAPAQAPVQQPPAEAQQDSGVEFDTEVTGEEQDYYDRVVMAGMKAMFEDEGTHRQIVDRLKADTAHPAKDLAETTAILMIQLDKKDNDNIPETVILPAAVELLEQLIDLADSMKLFPIDDAVTNRAGQILVQKLGEH